MRLEEKPSGPSAASWSETSSAFFFSVVEKIEVVEMALALLTAVEVIGENASTMTGRVEAAAAIASEMNFMFCWLFLFCE